MDQQLLKRLELFRQYTIYLLGMMLQKISAFALIPIYTSWLSTAEYGILEIVNSFLGFASLFVSLGVPSALNKCYLRDGSSKEDRKIIVGTCIIFSIPFLTMLLMFGFFFERSLAILLFGRDDYVHYIRLMLLSMFLTQTTLIPMQLLRTLGLPGKYVMLSALQMVTQISFSLILLVVFKFGVMAILIANLTGYVAVQLATLHFLRQHLYLRFSWQHLKNLASFGLALVPINLCAWVIDVSDRFFLLHLGSSSEVGIYSLGYKFGILIDMILVMPFQKAWNPYYFSIADKDEAKIVFSRTITYYFSLLCLGVGILIVCAEPLIHIMSHSDYYQASKIIPLIAISYLLYGLAICFNTTLIVMRRVKIAVTVFVCGALANLILNWTLIPRYGMVGAGLSTLLAFGIMFTLISWSVAIWYPISLEFQRLFKAFLTTVILSVLALQIDLRSLPLEIFIRSLILISMPGILLLTNFFNQEEIQTVRMMVQRFVPSYWILSSKAQKN